MSELDKIIYSMYKVSKHYNRETIIADISLSYFYGAKIGVLGLNGSGKSTLLRIMAGVDSEYEGEIHVQPGFTVGYMEQEPELEKGKVVREIVEEGVQDTVDLLRAYEELNAQFAEPMDDDQMNALIERQAKMAEELDAVGAWDLDSRLEMAMDALRCPPEDQVVDTLSGGEKRRVALCRLLLRKPDILLLDEPTNHLDAETVAWLEGHLQQYEGTVIAVTHDRYFLDNVAGWILELDQGRGVPWKGNYSSWLEQKDERLRLEEKSEGERQRTLERELEWIRMTPRAKQQKNKARIRAYEELINQDKVRRNEEMQIYIPPGPRLGDIAIEAKSVSKSYDDRILFENMEFALPSGGIVGVIGPNDELESLCLALQFRWRRPAAGGWHALGRSTQSGAPGEGAQGAGQCALARRADQRPRRQYAAGLGRRPGGFCRLCGDHQSRSLVSRSDRDAYPGLRGR